MKRNQQQAFTILELVTTIAIASIVMAVAVPGLRTFIQNERLTSTTNTLLADMMLARSEAVERNLPAIICSSSNETSCTGGSFADGWIVGVDANNNGVLDADERIKVQQAIQDDVKFNSNMGGTINYDNRGFNPGAVGLISICDDRGPDHAKALSISRTGRVSRGDNPSCP